MVKVSKIGSFMSDLHTFLRNAHPISDACLGELDEAVSIKHVRKRELLLKTGGICYNLHWVRTGMLRSFYSGEEKKVTTSFAKENEICVSRDELMREFWMQSATHRYCWFRDHHPELYQRIQGKYLASYLGMTNVMLSKLRGRKSLVLD
jgi:hypothetical protein